ncbi:unnamed protein product, partial [Ixodes pacificus]
DPVLAEDRAVGPRPRTGRLLVHPLGGLAVHALVLEDAQSQASGGHGPAASGARHARRLQDTRGQGNERTLPRLAKRRKSRRWRMGRRRSRRAAALKATEAPLCFLGSVRFSSGGA